MSKIVLISEDDLTEKIKNAVECALREFEKEREIEQDRLFTISQVSKKLGMSWSTVRKLVDSGTIISTTTKRIPASELRKFLNKQ